MEMELSSDGGECKGGSGVGYGKKPMDSLEKQVHRVVNSSLSLDGCAQATRGFKGDGDGGNSAQSDRMECEGEGNVTVTC